MKLKLNTIKEIREKIGGKRNYFEKTIDGSLEIGDNISCFTDDMDKLLDETRIIEVSGKRDNDGDLIWVIKDNKFSVTDWMIAEYL